MPEEQLTDGELDELGEFLDDPEAPADRLTLTAFDGFSAGLGVSSATIEPDRWLEIAIGGESGTEGTPAKILELMVRHAVAVRRVIQEGASEEFTPIFDALEDEEGEEEEVSPVEWCAGFLLATDLYPESFSSLAEDEEAVNLMLPMVVFGTEEGIEALEGKEGEDGLAEDLIDSIQPSVLGLCRFFNSRS